MNSRILVSRCLEGVRAQEIGPEEANVGRSDGTENPVVRGIIRGLKLGDLPKGESSMLSPSTEKCWRRSSGTVWKTAVSFSSCTCVAQAPWLRGLLMSVYTPRNEGCRQTNLVSRTHKASPPALQLHSDNSTSIYAACCEMMFRERHGSFTRECSGWTIKKLPVQCTNEGCKFRRGPAGYQSWRPSPSPCLAPGKEAAAEPVPEFHYETCHFATTAGLRSLESLPM